MIARASLATHALPVGAGVYWELILVNVGMKTASWSLGRTVKCAFKIQD